MWRVTGDEVVADSRYGRPDRGLVPGTLLRLDGEVSQVFRDGYFGASGDYTITTRFFCAIDGAMAGTCWEAVGFEDMRDPANVLWDPVERL
jgi:hypothetical protein